MDSTGVRVLLEAADARAAAPADRRRRRTGDARVTIEETGIAPLLPLVDGDAERPR